MHLSSFPATGFMLSNSPRSSPPVSIWTFLITRQCQGSCSATTGIGILYLFIANARLFRSCRSSETFPALGDCIYLLSVRDLSQYLINCFYSRLKLHIDHVDLFDFSCASSCSPRRCSCEKGWRGRFKLLL